MHYNTRRPHSSLRYRPSAPAAVESRELSSSASAATYINSSTGTKDRARKVVRIRCRPRYMASSLCASASIQPLSLVDCAPWRGDPRSSRARRIIPRCIHAWTLPGTNRSPPRPAAPSNFAEHSQRLLTRAATRRRTHVKEIARPAGLVRDSALKSRCRSRRT